MSTLRVNTIVVTASMLCCTSNVKVEFPRLAPHFFRILPTARDEETGGDRTGGTSQIRAIPQRA